MCLRVISRDAHTFRASLSQLKTVCAVIVNATVSRRRAPSVCFRVHPWRISVGQAGGRAVRPVHDLEHMGPGLRVAKPG